MMKTSVVCLLLSIVALSECALKTQNKGDILKRDDNDHFCCNIELPLEYISKTRIVAYTRQAGGQHKCGYQGCGFLGWGSCTKWCWSYWLATTYHTDTYKITKETECPANNIVCCKDYMMIKGHCFHISEIQNNAQLLIDLANEGVIVPGGGIGK